MRISDWSSDVCSSDLAVAETKWHRIFGRAHQGARDARDGPSGARSLFGDALFLEPSGLRRDRREDRRRHEHGGGDRGSRLPRIGAGTRSEEHTSELQSLMRNSYAVFCLNKKNLTQQQLIHTLATIT